MPLDTSVLTVVETLYEFLERTPVAIVLLDGQKRVVFANERAAALHTRADGVTICDNGIGLHRAHDNTRLQGLIARAICASDAHPGRRSPGHGSRSMRALRSSGKRPYGVLVAPVSPRDSDSTRTSFRPAVCILIADPDEAPAVPIERLQDAFDLTEAESRLAARLAAGEGLQSAAHALGITYGTARARLAEIFQKTQTRRQGELITLLLTTLAAV